MSGFCPDDWHGTTMEDVRQMEAGEDFDFLFDPRYMRAASFARRPAPDPRYCQGCGGEGSVGRLLPDGGGYDQDPCSWCNGTGLPTDPPDSADAMLAARDTINGRISG